MDGVYTQSTYNTETGYLAIPEVKVNGNTFYNNVGIRLNFVTGTFEFVSGDARPETDPNPNPGGISTTPIDTDSIENVLKLDFMGCERSTNSSATCHVLFTSLGEIDREVTIIAQSVTTQSELYDSNGVGHVSVGIANMHTIGSPMGGWGSKLFVAGVPTLVKYQFRNISPERGLSLFKPAFEIYNEYYTASYRKF